MFLLDAPTTGSLGERQHASRHRPLNVEQELAMVLFEAWADALGLRAVELHGLLPDPAGRSLNAILRIEVDLMIEAAWDLNLLRTGMGRRVGSGTAVSAGSAKE